MTESVSKKGFAAIIAAGGSGSRFSQDAVQKTGTALPKQFLTLKGRPLYFWSLRELILNNSIDNIVMVAPAQILDDLRAQVNEIRRELGTTKTIAVIEGGGSRQESVFKGMLYLKNLDHQPEYVLIHDAARPFLDADTIERVVKCTIDHDACTVGGAVSDTIKRVRDGKVLETLLREELCAVQTPQAARFQALLDAHEKASISGYATTDDAALLEWAAHDVRVVAGPAYNLKITQPLDLMLSESLAHFLLKDPL